MNIDELFEKLSNSTFCIDNDSDAYRFLGLLKRLEDLIYDYLFVSAEDFDDE